MADEAQDGGWEAPELMEKRGWVLKVEEDVLQPLVANFKVDSVADVE